MIAAEIGRHAQQAQNDEGEEAGSLHRLVVGCECRHIDAEDEYKSNRGKDADKNVPMRPRLRNKMHLPHHPKRSVILLPTRGRRVVSAAVDSPPLPIPPTYLRC